MAEKIKNNKNTLTGFGLALMAFAGVWSFGNVCNGFGYFGGTQVIIPWLIVFILYFLPYSLMVGELGSVFKNTDGGVAVWCFKTIGPRVAFLAGWIYWIVHMPYISQKPNMIVISLNWIVNGNGSVSNMPVVTLQLLCLVTFIVGFLLSLRGASMVKTISKVAGMATFVMMILYILMIFAAPAIKPATSEPLRSFNVAENGIFPNDMSLLINMSVLILAVGGCEKISPYVKSMKDPGKGFPRGMILLVIMVFITAVLGTIAMNSFYDGQNLPSDFLTNGQFEAFVKLGEYYGIGKILMYFYAIANSLAQFAAIIISIDAPLRILLGNADTNFIPKWWLKKNKHGCYVNGAKVVAIIVSALIIIPCIGIGSVDQLVKWLIKLNSVCMPIRYLFVFIAYIALKQKIDQFPNNDYVFIKKKWLGKLCGGWCFFITFVSCMLGMYSESIFEFGMNVCTPIILCGIGLILPKVARRNKKLANK